MYVIIGFLMSTMLVLLSRVIYLQFFNSECKLTQCFLQVPEIQMWVSGGIILLGTLNVYMISKKKNNQILMLEFTTTFLIAFAMNFISTPS